MSYMLTFPNTNSKSFSIAHLKEFGNLKGRRIRNSFLVFIAKVESDTFFSPVQKLTKSPMTMTTMTPVALYHM